MKLRNKRTGEIIDIKGALRDSDDYPNHYLISNDWEDYEELKEWWYIDIAGEVKQGEGNVPEHLIDGMKLIGNYFETKEEAEKAVEKFKARKRLKDKGFRFEGIKEDYTRILQSQDPFRTGKRYLQFNKSEDEEWMEENWKDLDLLFGGEE